MSNRHRSITTYLILLLLPILIMLPRLLSPQFGLLDDPGILLQANQILAGKWSLEVDASRGRFRPVYWLFNALLLELFGENPLGFFIGNTLLLAVLVLALFNFVKRMGGSEVQAWTVIATLIFSGPLLESVYTLSKPELLQAVFIAGFLWAGSSIIDKDSTSGMITAALSAAVIALLACLTKETAILLAPLSIGLYALFLLTGRLGWTAAKWKRWSTALVFSAGFGALIYLIIRSRYLPFNLIGEGYSSGFTFEWEYMFSNARIWLDILSRDYVFLAPLAIIAFVNLLDWDKDGLAWYLVGGIWATGWFLVYIPWRFTQLYYLLPFSMGVSLFSGAAVSEFVRSAKRRLGWRNAVGWVSLAIGGMLFAANIVNQRAYVKMQLAVDASNEEMLQYVAAIAEHESSLAINIQQPNEYVGQFASAVRYLNDREDLFVGYVRMDELEKQRDGKTYYILPVLENQFYPSFRMGIFEHTSRKWNRELLEALEIEGSPGYRVRNSFRVLLIDPLRIFCPLTPGLAYCQVPNTPFDTRRAAYGWDIYEITAEQGGEG